MNSFHPDHLADLRKSGLSDETIAAAAIKTVPPGEITRRLGFDIPALESLLEFPYDKSFSRFKAFYANGKSGPKYLQRKGSGNRLYIPPQVRPMITDAVIPLYITEGEKKALKAAQERLCCIGLSGLWNWSNGEKKLIDDFDQIALERRPVFLVPDNDWRTPNKHGYKKNLVQAVLELAKKLKARGAKI